MDGRSGCPSQKKAGDGHGHGHGEAVKQTGWGERLLSMADASPYRIPAPPPALDRADGAADRAAAYRCLGWAALTWVVTLFASVLFMSRWVGVCGFGVGVVLAGLGAVRAIVGVVRVGRGPSPRRLSLLFHTATVFLANSVFLAFGALSTLLASVGGFHRGRQLRSFGRVLLPRVVSGGAWAKPRNGAPAPRIRDELDPSVRGPLAAQWRENGRTEHASVAAFARLTLDLLALGAPPHLVASAQEDALDEVRHTELCFQLARALDGASESPGPFPEARAARTLEGVRSLALAELAVGSLIDGALHEGISARIVARLARCCGEPTIKAVLKEIAADEGRHAAHGWEVVEWCFAQGGAPVAHALTGAARMLPQRMASPLPDAARGGGWERYGIQGHALEAEEHAKARAELVLRVHKLVGSKTKVAA